MLRRLRDHLLPLLRGASPLPSPVHTGACRLISTSTSKATSRVPFSLEDYLVTACGLAPAQAREVSKKASRELSARSHRTPDKLSYSPSLNSASKPDAILALLSGAGLSRADIAAVVSADPLLLRASVKNIAPRILALRDRIGLSTPQIARFLLVDSRALRCCDGVPRLEFFISFYGSFEQVLVALKRNQNLLKASLERVIKPNIALFRQWGVPDIAKLCSNFPRVLTYNPERVKEFLPRAEQLGVPPTSGLFGQAVAVVACLSEEKVAAKLEFFKRTLGCSESEVSTAVSKAPAIIGLSDEILLRKIEFLVNEAAMGPRYIVERPTLLTYSLEKRIVPRHNAMKVLQEKGLLNINMSFFRIIKLGEETFKLKFVDCHKDSVPGLADAYAAARAGIVLSKVGGGTVTHAHYQLSFVSEWRDLLFLYQPGELRDEFWKEKYPDIVVAKIVSKKKLSMEQFGNASVARITKVFLGSKVCFVCHGPLTCTRDGCHCLFVQEKVAAKLDSHSVSSMPKTKRRRLGIGETISNRQASRRTH